MLTITDPVTVANRLRPVLLQLNRQLRRELAPLGITGGQAALLHLVLASGHRRPRAGPHGGRRPPQDVDRAHRLEGAGLCAASAPTATAAASGSS